MKNWKSTDFLLLVYEARHSVLHLKCRVSLLTKIVVIPQHYPRIADEERILFFLPLSIAGNVAYADSDGAAGGLAAFAANPQIENPETIPFSILRVVMKERSG